MSDRPSWYGYNHKQNEKVLDLGCGITKVPGSIGVDVIDRPSVDVVHDLDVVPYPFQDNTFDAVYLNHCIEHLAEPGKVLKECMRIAKPGGDIFITVPHFTNPAAFGDVTHRRYFSYRAIPGLARGLKCNKKVLTLRTMRVTSRISFLTPVINLSPRFWEDYFGFLFPGRALYYLFQVEEVASGD